MDKIILAIETSIKAGSLAVLCGADVVDRWTGNNDVSRSEDLIPHISLLLERNQIELSRVQKIAVSTGPGSFTGIRVGFAVAKGLAFSLSCELTGVSILEAIEFADLIEVEKQDEKRAVVVSAGRDLYFWQIFLGSVAITDAETGNKEFLENRLVVEETFMILAEQDAYKNLFRSEFRFLPETQAVVNNYAELIGKYVVKKNGKSENISPLYIRPAVVIKK